MTESRFRDLPAAAFPLVVEMFDPESPWTAEPEWRVEVPGPGAVQVPAFGRSMRVRSSYADGAIVYAVPDLTGADRVMLCRRRRVDGPTVDMVSIPPTEVPDGKVLLQVASSAGRSVGRRFDRDALDAGGLVLVEREYRILERRLGIEYVPCPCQRYMGPELLRDVWAPGVSAAGLPTAPATGPGPANTSDRKPAALGDDAPRARLHG